MSNPLKAFTAQSIAIFPAGISSSKLYFILRLNLNLALDLQFKDYQFE